MHFRKFPPMAGIEDGCAGSGGLLGGDAGERDRSGETERNRDRDSEKRESLESGRGDGEWGANLRKI